VPTRAQYQEEMFTGNREGHLLVELGIAKPLVKA
jgi:hypothetical protein